MTHTSTPTDTEHLNPDPLLTVDEAASYLNLSASFVRQRITDGTLPARRFGRSVRIARSTIRAYAEGSR